MQNNNCLRNIEKKIPKKVETIWNKFEGRMWFWYFRPIGVVGNKKEVLNLIRKKIQNIQNSSSVRKDKIKFQCTFENKNSGDF